MNRSTRSWDAIAPDVSRIFISETLPKLQETFSVIDDTLFNMAEKGGGIAQMEALRIVRNNKQTLLTDWPLHVDKRIKKWGEKLKDDDTQKELSLVEDDEMEENLAIAQSSETFYKQAAELFNAISPFWGEFLDITEPSPLTPRGISITLSSWLKTLPINTAERLVVLKIIEREFAKTIPSLLKKTIEGLKPHGFNPVLFGSPRARMRVAVSPQGRRETQNNPAPAGAQDIREQPTPTINEQQMQQQMQRQPQPRYLQQSYRKRPAMGRDMDEYGEQTEHRGEHARAPSYNLPPHDLSPQDLVQAFQDFMAEGMIETQQQPRQPMYGQSAERQTNRSMQDQNQSYDIHEADVDPILSDLIDALRHRRIDRAHKQPENTSNTHYPIIGAGILKSVLNDMQKDLPLSVRQAARKNDHTLAEEFKEAMLQSAVAGGRATQGSKLNSQDEDAVDIVGMLFDIFLTDRRMTDDMREHIARLLAPYVKVALSDRKMFMQKSHPARKFLDVLAEACEGNDGVSPQEKSTLSKVTKSIDQLVSEFNEDVAIFELIETEIRDFMTKQRASVEMAEKRALEAERGKERLEIAKRQTVQIFSEHTKQCNWPIKTMELLRNCWCQNHMMTILKPKQEAGAIEASLTLLERMILIGTTGTAANKQLILNGIHDDIAGMLAASAITGQAADDLSLNIVKALDQASLMTHSIKQSGPKQNSAVAEEPVAIIAEPIPALVAVFDTETIAQKDREIELLREEVKRKTMSAQEAGEVVPVDVPVGPLRRASLTDRELIDYFKNMEMGTWVDFVKSDGALISTKLSWVSPISNRLLFVTARGQKHAVESPEDLAIMVRLERVRLREVGLGEGGFEHSYKQAVQNIREDTQKPAGVTLH